MKKLSLTFTLLFALTSLSIAQQVNTRHLNLDKGVAIKGYDPISYFSNGEPTKGKKDLTFIHEGAKYQFISQENLDLFKANPTKYAPVYGGWCAYAVSKGYTADANPKTFKIVDGKLHLFYNRLLVNTLPKWNKDEDNLKKSAEKNWPKIKAEKKGN